jgi:hypothetical protein
MIEVSSREALRHAATVTVSALFALALVGPAAASGRAQGEHAAAAIAPEPSSRSEAPVSYSVGPINDVSGGCQETGDVEEATDPVRGYVYVAFEGYDHGDGIGFARSTNAGMSYSQPVALPGPHGGWGPYLAVAPDGRTPCVRSRPATRVTPSISRSRPMGPCMSRGATGPRNPRCSKAAQRTGAAGPGWTPPAS